MRAFIYYYYFSPERLTEFIKNNSNNENWPKTSKYLSILEDFGKTFQRQMKLVEKYSEWVSNTRKGDENFVIQIKSVISSRLKLMRDPDFKYLNEDKTIELTDTLRQEEIMSLKEGLKIWEIDKQFKKNWADTELTEKFDYFKTFRSFVEWNNRRKYSIRQVGQLLKKWSENEKKLTREFHWIEEIRTFEIELKERTKDSITFVWNVAKVDVPDYRSGKKDDKGNLLSGGFIKKMVIPNVPNFLFYFQGQYYEVLDWEQTNYNTVEIEAELSVFYNFYYYVLKCSANGILHQSPLIENEICSCAEYDRSDVFEDFISSYFLRLAVYRTSITNGGIELEYDGEKSYLDGALPLIQGMKHNYVGMRIEDTKKESDYILSKKLWSDFWNAISGISIMGFSLGGGVDSSLGVIYRLLNADLLGKSREIKSQRGYGWYKPLAEDGFIKNTLDFTRNSNNFLIKWKLLNEDATVNDFMSHFLIWHVKATLYWRKKQIWEGRYWMLHKYGIRIDECCNDSGNTISIFAFDLMLVKFTESITCKIGLSGGGAQLVSIAIDPSLNDDKSQNLRQVERTTVSDTKKKDGSETHSETTTKSRTPISGGGNTPRIKIPSVLPLLHGTDHVKSEYTFYQFESRWQNSGYYPLGLRIQFNKDLLNQYRNRKELKGSPGYEYFNSENFGEILSVPGFLQASIISWNNVPYANWFRTKIEGGVYLYEYDHREFYQKNITNPLNFPSLGANIKGTWNTLTISESRALSSGWDDASHAGTPQGLYVYYNSWLRVGTEKGLDIFSWLMGEVQKRRKATNDGWRIGDTFWSYIHQPFAKSPVNWEETFEIPGQWKSSEWPEHKGQKVARLFFYFNFYSSEKKGQEGDKNDAVSIKVRRISYGTTGKIEIELLGRMEYQKVEGNPEGIPALTNTVDPSGTSGRLKMEAFNPNTPLPTSTLIEPDPIADPGSGLEIELPDPEQIKEKEKPLEKEQIREKVKEQVKVKEKVKTKEKTKEGEK